MKPTLSNQLILGGCAAAALMFSSCGPSDADKKDQAAPAAPAASASSAPSATPPPGDLIDINPEILQVETSDR